MPLDNFDIDSSNEKKASEHDSGALAQFSESFAYEARREWSALGQLAGRDVHLPDAPNSADTVLGRHAQMFGAAAADMIPALGVALLSRYAFGLRASSEPFYEEWLKVRSPIGLNTRQAASTGFVTAFFLQPTEGADADSELSILGDRTKRALASAVTYGAMNGVSFGAEALGSKIPGELLRGIATHPIVTGIVSGGLGGVVSAETESLATTYSITTDLSKINQSAYQMALFGGAFGGISRAASTIHEEHFSSYAFVRGVVDSDNKPALANLKRLKNEGLDFDYVVKQTDFGDTAAVAFYNRLFQSDISVKHMNTLQALRELNDVVKPDDATFERIVKVSGEQMDALSMAKYLRDDPQSRVPLFAELMQKGLPSQRINVDSVDGLKFLYDAFGKESPITSQIKALDNDGHRLLYIGSASKDIHQPVLSSLLKQIAETGNPELLQLKTLRALGSVSRVFGDDSFASSRLVPLANEGLDIPGLAFQGGITGGVAHAFGEDINAKVTYDQAYMDLAKTMIEQGESADKLQPIRLMDIRNLTRMYGEGSDSLNNVLRLESARTTLHELARFASDSEQNRDLLADRAMKVGRPEDLRLDKLKDLANLTKLQEWFPSDSKAMSALKELQQGSLTASRLEQYIREDPSVRVPIVEQLIDRGADSDRFNDQMSLNGLPDDVAIKVADDLRVSGERVSRVIGPLKDWQSGRYFRELLSNYARDGQPINAKEVDHLAEQAKDLAREGALLAERKPDLDDVRKRFAENLKRSDGNSATTAEGQLELLTQILHSVADKISTTVPKESSIVLLGRDSWPLLPVLQDRGLKAQYFLWSRLQQDDAATRAQWLKEVPPDSRVIDTGYRGSIINWARETDDSVRGYLFSSSDKKRYEQLVPNKLASSSVSMLEGFPKMIGRSNTYTESGSAVARFANRDRDEKFRGSQTGFRWMVEAENRRLLKALNLPEWDVWRYGTFTGLSPLERIRANTSEDLEAHYRSVQQQRDHMAVRDELQLSYGQWF